MTDALIGPLTQCQVCFSTSLDPVLDFGHQPLVHAHLAPAKLKEPETHYPLALSQCRDCGLVQLGYAVDPRIVFPPEYPYHSGMTKILRENFDELASSMFSEFGVREGDLVIDIGSNDGTLLEAFRRRGARVVGIEPTDAAAVAVRNGIPTVNEFFTPAVACDVRAEHGPARLVTATNVFAHVNNLHPLLEGIGELVADGGLFVSESHYLPSLLDKAQYDTVYHEHLRYYSLRPLRRLLTGGGFSVVDAKRIPTHGGSLRVVAVKGRGSSSARLEALAAEEESAGLYSPATFARFAEQVRQAKLALMELVMPLRRQGRTMAGVGAPARATMLLSYCHLDADILSYTGERAGSPKIGLYTPGTHIPVVDEERLLRDQPDFAVLLSWHIGGEIMAALRARGFKGAFITPLPTPQILHHAHEATL